MKIPLAWLNLAHNKTRTLAATVGLAFVIMLIFVQLGLRASVVTSAMYVYNRLSFDFVVVSPHYLYMNATGTFQRIRLYQALTVNGVEDAMPFYISLAKWRNPQTGLRHNVLMLAFNPDDRVFLLPEVVEQMNVLRQPDTVLVDRYSRPAFGPLHTGVVTELERRKVSIAGQVTLGSGFAALGTIIVGDQNFARTLNRPSLDQVSLGLIKIAPGAKADMVAQDLRLVLPPDVQVLTRAELEQTETHYWIGTTSIGIIFDLGVFVAFLVGTAVFYQVLATDIANRFAEYATLKALGYTDGYVSLAVWQQAGILIVMGFIPAIALALGTYEVIRRTAHILINMTLMRVVLVLLVVIVMGLIASLVALQKIKKADPAELF